MTKHFVSGNLARLLYGGGVSDILLRRAAEIQDGLRKNIVDYANALDDVKNPSHASSAEADALATNAASQMNAEAMRGAQNLAASCDELDNARKYLIAFVLKHGIDRKPEQPDALFSAVIFALLGVFEGMLTALFFLGGGFVAGFGEALGLGLSISGINVVVAGLIGGGFFGRFWNYGLHAPEPDVTMKRKRLAGRVGSVVTACLLLLLLLASGILRASGEPEHLGFTFETIGAAATNFHSLLLWALGLSFSILAWKKGLRAFSDPYPGFSEASKAITRSDEGMHDAYHEANDAIKDIADEAQDDLADLAEEAQDLRAELESGLKIVRRKREEVLSAIAGAPTEFAAFCETQSATLRIVNPKNDLDLTGIKQAFEADVTALRTEAPAIPESLNLDLDSFEEARAKAELKISQALFGATQTLNDAYSKALSHNA